MKLYIFNGNYAVVAGSKEEAREKLAPHLEQGHNWYLRPDAENPREQGHLTVRELKLDKDVAYLGDR